MSKQKTDKEDQEEFNVVIKNWKTGEVIRTYSNVSPEDLRYIKAEHHQFAPPSWDLEFAKV